MLIANLYNKVLIEPPNDGAAELFAVSGYASATFANRHLNEVDGAVINLIIGMPGRRIDHIAYVQLCNLYPERFRAYYLEGSPPIHSKVYGWFQNNEPFVGFAGSANYSQPGFLEATQINQISDENPTQIKSFFDSLLERSIRVQDAAQPEAVEITEAGASVQGSVIAGGLLWEIPNSRVRISFLAKNGTLPQRSGLNWGQRPDEGREPNQAYLSIKGDARDEGFLPPAAFTFTLLTDDGQSIDCAVAQQGRKAIHSNANNSEIGIYFRNRIGVPLGNPVILEDLVAYGRTDYTIQKINEETYYLDFSV